MYPSKRKPGLPAPAATLLILPAFPEAGAALPQPAEPAEKNVPILPGKSGRKHGHPGLGAGGVEDDKDVAGPAVHDEGAHFTPLQEKVTVREPSLPTMKDAKSRRRSSTRYG